MCRRLGADPHACLAIEDSGSGIESALAAGMRVVAVPRPGFEPDPGGAGRANAVLPDLTLLSSDVIRNVLPPA